jgi:tetrahydromethanopterin S-methyltransferase subunit H
MFNFKKEQQVFDFGAIKIGGNVGQYPTVLIGSIFHKGDKIVSDEKSGIFDKKKAEELIFLQKELSDKSGNPCMLDVVGTHERALKNYIDFISNLTNEPFLLNAITSNLRIKLLKYIEEIGLNDRIIYTSINYTATKEEFYAIKLYKIKSALIQSLNPRNPRITGMIDILIGKNGNMGLIEMAKKFGVKNLLLFTNVFETPTIGIASRGIYRLKNLIGLPTGTAPVGAVSKWCVGNNLFKGKFKEACESTGVTLAQAMGADFIIYGALKKAEYIFPAAAIVDAMISLNSRITFKIRTTEKNHPIYKLTF